MSKSMDVQYARHPAIFSSKAVNWFCVTVLVSFCCEKFFCSPLWSDFHDADVALQHCISFSPQVQWLLSDAYNQIINYLEQVIGADQGDC